jgi:cell division septum initiation protein DivIVA
VIGRFDEEQDEQLENLVALNEQLNDENRELREHVKQLEKELISAHETDSVRVQLQELHECNELLEGELQ